VTAEVIVQEPVQFQALLEVVQKEQNMLAEAHRGHVERLDELERRFEARFDQVERRIMEVDVKLDTKIRALDTRVRALETKVDALDTRVRALDTRLRALEAKVDALDTKLDAKFGALAIGIERIAAFLGLGSVIPPVLDGPRG